MPAPTPEDIDLARRGAQAALRRVAEHRFPDADIDGVSGCIAVVETLWWVCLLAEQLNYPYEAHQKLRGNSDSESEADLARRTSDCAQYGDAQGSGCVPPD